MVELYVKVTALNFDTTVLDSDDLSTIRGSSLTLLRFPEALLRYLRETFDGLSIEPLQASASETMLRISVEQAERHANQYEPKRPARGMSRNGWIRAVRGAARDLGPSADADTLRSAADGLCEKFSQLKDRSRIDVVIEQIDTAIAALPASSAPAVDLEVEGSGIEQACRDFTRERTDGWAFDHFTFAVASYLDRKGQRLQAIFTILNNRLRRKQQQSLTVALPDRGVSPLPPANRAVCQVTGILAADLSIDSPEPRSTSVHLRRKSGRQQRFDFYEEQLRIAAERAEELLEGLPENIFSETARSAVKAAAGTLPNLAQRFELEQLSFAKSFEDIVDEPPQHLPPGAKNKLAVIHIDGNRFGDQARVRAQEKDRTAYRRYSLYLEAQGGLLLKAVLDWMLPRETMKVYGTSEEGEAYRLRFETLLWGGDEMTFVLPAWEAAEFMTMLQAALKTWPIPELGKAKGNLTFAVGMVFGHYKTPIRDLRRVADQLCAAVKKGKREGNWLQVLSLEGIDRADIDPVAVRKVLLGASEEHASDFDIQGERWTELVETARRLADSLGQTQLHRHYRKAESEGLIKIPLDGDEAARKSRLETRKERRAAMIRRLGELGVEGTTAAELGSDLFAAGSGAWPFLPLHQLLGLWDFVTPVVVAEPSAKEKAA